MRRPIARTGQRVRSPLGECPTTSPQTPFFCLPNVREQKVEVNMSASDAVVRFSFCMPRKSCVSFSLKGVDSAGLMAYSPGLSRKKNAIQIMSEIAILKLLLEARATVMRQQMTGTGTGLTRFGGGSSLAYALSIWLSLKTMLPPVSRRGSGAPRARYVCATPCKYSSAEQDLISLLLAEDWPVQTRRRKTQITYFVIDVYKVMYKYNL